MKIKNLEIKNIKDLKKIPKKIRILILCGIIAITSVIMFPTLFVRREGSLSSVIWRPEDNFMLDSEGNVQQAAATLRKTPGKDFVIVNFTDTQVNAESDWYKTGTIYKTMKKIIEQKNPDLITFSGDIAWGPVTLQCYRKFIRVMDGFKIPWAICFGNHDSDWNADSNFLAETVMKSKYGIFMKGPRDIYGVSNYFINIVERQDNGQDKVVHTVFLLDSQWGGMSFSEEQIEEIRDYTYLTESDMAIVKQNAKTLKSTYFADCADYSFDNYFYVNPLDEEYLQKRTGSNEKGSYIQIGSGDGNIMSTQIMWYEWVLKHNALLNEARGFGYTMPESTCVFHIAFFEFYQAYKEWLIAIRDNDETKLAEMQAVGRMRFEDPVCTGSVNFHFFDKMKELGSTKNVVVGHDHINDFSLVYQGIRLTYGVKTGKKVYHDDLMNGGTCFTIGDASTKTEQVYIDL